MEKGLKTDEQGVTRCWWPGDHEDYTKYHDEEWGNPVNDNFRLFEKICLEGFQSGLSWLTILRKRENFRTAFLNFNFYKIAEFGEKEKEQLVQNAGIIRHRGKIASTINNARKAIEMVEEFGSLSKYFWQYEPGPNERPTNFTYETLMKITTSPASVRLSKDLKKRGWSFVGPTTAYAFMQAMGMVNDHLEGCHSRAQIEEKRKKFIRP